MQAVVMVRTSVGGREATRLRRHLRRCRADLQGHISPNARAISRGMVRALANSELMGMESGSMVE